MRAPVEFVVTRHLLMHPDDPPTRLARHCHIAPESASRALKRLREYHIESDSQRFAHLQSLSTRPHWPEYGFQAPNPDNWPDAFGRPHWLTGEVAAAMEGMDLVPSRIETYVHADDLQDAFVAARDIYAKTCRVRDADLVIRVADPWMHLRPDDALVERGQRLYDYARSRNVQFAKELDRLG